jgi:hypothetical protein
MCTCKDKLVVLGISGPLQKVSWNFLRGTKMSPPNSFMSSEPSPSFDWSGGNTNSRVLHRQKDLQSFNLLFINLTLCALRNRLCTTRIIFTFMRSSNQRSSLDFSSAVEPLHDHNWLLIQVEGTFNNFLTLFYPHMSSVTHSVLHEQINDVS